MSDDIEKNAKNVLNKKSFFNRNVIFSLFYFFLAFGFILFYFFMIPSISLNGDKNIEINYNEEYIEPGYSASYLNKDISDKVYVIGGVDSSKLGVYSIKYNVRKNKIVVSKERRVSVVDKENPSITLVGNNSVEMCPNVSYIEEGFSALDNYDGDLTDKVKINVSDDFVSYEVVDSSGNVATIKRILKKNDNVLPVITLKQGNNYYLKRGSKYVEPGFTATDNCDGDLTNFVSVSGSVDSSVVGKNEIIYSVVDSSGNKYSITRVVNVYNEPETNPEVKGVIYLTFDDGPSGSITPKLLDILKEKNVKATFFVVNHSSNLDYLIQREYNEGHTVALHSMTHDYAKIYSSKDAYFYDLEAISKKVEKLTGQKSMIIRFPGGSSNTVSRNYSRGIMTLLTKEVLNRGYHYFDWNVSSGDAGGAKTSQDVYRNVVGGLSKKRSNIVLLHDFESNYKTLNAISDIIDYGKANGYEFLAIDMSTSMVRHSVNN